MKMTEEEKTLVLDHNLKICEKTQEKEYGILENAWGIKLEHFDYIKPVQTEQKIEKLDIVSMQELLNKQEIKPNTVKIYLEEYNEQYEEQWVHDSGINLITVELVKNKMTTKRLAHSSLNYFNRQYEFKSEHQANGKDYKRMRNLLDKLIKK